MTVFGLCRYQFSSSSISQLGFQSTPSSKVAYPNFRINKCLSSRRTFDSKGLSSRSLKSFSWFLYSLSASFKRLLPVRFSDISLIECFIGSPKRLVLYFLFVLNSVEHLTLPHLIRPRILVVVRISYPILSLFEDFL